MERRHLATESNGLRAAAGQQRRRRHGGGELIDAQQSMRDRNLNLKVLPKELNQLRLQPNRTNQNERFRLWKLRSAVVILALEWMRYITDGGITSGGPGKSAESFATCASARRTIRTSPASVAGPTQ